MLQKDIRVSALYTVTKRTKMSDHSVSDTNSDSGSDISNIEEILNEPMYYILMQFLVAENGKNIATILSELATELKRLNDARTSA